MVRELWPEPWEPRPVYVDDDVYDSVKHLRLPVGVGYDYLKRIYNKIIQCPPGFTVDHIDMDRYNNVRENLRILTPLENQRRKNPPQRKRKIWIMKELPQ